MIGANPISFAEPKMSSAIETNTAQGISEKEKKDKEVGRTVGILALGGIAAGTAGSVMYFRDNKALGALLGLFLIGPLLGGASAFVYLKTRK